MMTDPIADMLTRIRNAQMARRSLVLVPFSKIKMRIAEILQREGYIGDITRQEGTPPMLSLVLKYTDRMPAIQEIKRESKPGHRMYRKAEEIPKVLNGYGRAIISTPQGLMTDKEAREKKIGGEVICSVY